MRDIINRLDAPIAAVAAPKGSREARGFRVYADSPTQYQLIARRAVSRLSGKIFRRAISAPDVRSDRLSLGGIPTVQLALGRRTRVSIRSAEKPSGRPPLQQDQEVSI
jgi:hypothetical protein